MGVLGVRCGVWSLGLRVWVGWNQGLGLVLRVQHAGEGAGGGGGAFGGGRVSGAGLHWWQQDSSRLLEGHRIPLR